jgi:quinol monooxygenase YgiN
MTVSSSYYGRFCGADHGLQHLYDKENIERHWRQGREYASGGVGACGRIRGRQEEAMAGSEKISVIAQIRAKSGHEDEVRTMMSALPGPSRKEDGCLRYDVLEDKHYPGSFFTYEEWESEAALEKHLQVNKEGLNKVKALLREDLRVSVLKVVA